MRGSGSSLAKRKAAAGDKGTDGLERPPLDTGSGEPRSPADKTTRTTRSDKAAAGLDTVSDPKKREKEKTTASKEVGPDSCDPLETEKAILEKLGPGYWIDPYDSKAIANRTEIRIGTPFYVPIFDDHPDVGMLKARYSCAEAAIREYNKRRGTAYEVSRIKMTNCLVVAGFKFYITFEAKLGEQVDTFEAEVVRGVKNVITVRLWYQDLEG